MPGLNICIDLGTDSVVCFVKGKGVVVNEPCVAAYDGEKLLAVGKKAYEMQGRVSDNIKVIRPVENGIVSDFTVAKHILQYFISKIMKNMVFKPNIITCLPSSVTLLESKTMSDLLLEAGAAGSEIYEEALCAALGSGIDRSNSKGTLLVDIGAGKTDIAVITGGKISISKSINIASKSFDEAISKYIKREMDIVIGIHTAERIKKRVGSAMLQEVELAVIEKGKNYITDMPECFEVSSTQVYFAIKPCLDEIIENVRSVLSLTPPELMSDISENGIYLTGGGALLKDMAKMFTTKLKVRSFIADKPIESVAIGLGKEKYDRK